MKRPVLKAAGAHHDRTRTISSLNALLLCHQEAGYLPELFSQIRSLSDSVRFTVRLDRPSAEVVKFVAAQTDVTYFASDAVVSQSGMKWAGARSEVYEAAPAADFGMALDDDLLFSPEALKELREYFNEPRPIDRVDILWRHLWDAPDQYTTHLPDHWAAAAWRWNARDMWSRKWVQHCPEAAAASWNSRRLKGVAYHYGYMKQADRDRNWNRSLRAGKIDAHTLGLRGQPKLVKIA